MKNAVKGAFAILLVLPLVLPITAAPVAKVKPEEVGMSSERLLRIDQMLERRIAAGQMSGAVAIVARKGKIVHLTAKGVADLESKQSVTPATMFRVASMTKPVTSVAVMMMIEEGKIRLNDPVSRYIPEFKGQKVAVAAPAPPSETPAPAAGERGGRGGGANAGGRGGQRGAPPNFTTVAAEREVTIKDLLTHVSGLSSGAMSNSTVQSIARKPGEKLADYIPRLGTTTLEFQPGSRWAYSAQAGHDTLGRIVEIASGERLDRYLRARIFDPLAMKDITFWPTDAQWPRVATFYRAEGGRLVKAATPNDTSSRNVYFRGSGGLYSTAEDYMPFGLMLANGGELNGRRVLSRKSVEMMTAVHAPDTLPGLPPGGAYGLSVRVVTNHALGGTLLSDGTYGWTGAQGTHFFVDPKEGVVGVLMVQTSNAELRREFEDLVAQSVAD